MNDVKRYDLDIDSPLRLWYVVAATDYAALAGAAAENAKLRELLNEATESAEADLLAVGHQHESQARTYAMRSLRSFIERARAAVQPSEQWPVCSVCRRRHGSETQHPCE